MTLALSITLCAALWWGWQQRAEVRDLRADNRLLHRQIADARIAEGIARQLLTEEIARGEAVAAAITDIYGGPDAPLPDHLRDLLSGGL